jgi:hypothetical protein
MIRPRIPQATTVVSVLKTSVLVGAAAFATLVSVAVLALGIVALLFAAGGQHFGASLIMRALLGVIPDAMIALGITGVFAALVLIAVPSHPERRG